MVRGSVLFVCSLFTQRVDFINVHKLTAMLVYCTWVTRRWNRCALAQTLTGVDVEVAQQSGRSSSRPSTYDDILCTVNDNRFCFVYVAFVDVCAEVNICKSEERMVGRIQCLFVDNWEISSCVPCASSRCWRPQFGSFLCVIRLDKTCQYTL